MKTGIKHIVIGCCAIASAATAQEGYVKPALTLEEVVVAPEAKPWAFPVYETPQVDPSTGSGTMSVGIFSWNVGGYPISIALGYALGGHTMDEKSGLIGVGWNLSCTGAVYREIAGMPDESKTFQFLSSQEIDSRESRDLSTDTRLGGGASYLDKLERREVDAMYDRYHYQFPGHSGSFIIKNGTPVLLPEDNVTITQFGQPGADKVKDFRITTPDGTQYEFTEREHTNYIHSSSDIKPGYLGLTYYNAVTKWHLKRIITPEGADTITYHYDTLGMWGVSRSHSSASRGVVFNNPGYSYTSSNNDTPSATSKIQTVDGRLLKKISSRTATVEFSHANKAGGEEEPKYISGLTVYNQDGTEVRKAEFKATSLNDGRRVLKSVEVTSDNELLDRHEFTYNNVSAKSYGDFFGYANGYATTHDQSIISQESGGLNIYRRPNPAKAVHGAMSTHTTATGLHTTFAYEPNSLPGDTVRIGIRIKSITMKDNVAGRTQIRTYAYGDPMCSIDFSKVGITPFVSLSGLSWTVGSGVNIKENHSVSASTLNSSRLPGTPLSAARIYYGSAVEEISGTGIDHPVRTEYEYDTSRCKLRRVGGSGEAATGNPYYIKGDMKMPDSSRPVLQKLFLTGFANYYFAECTFATPKLKVKREMVWENGSYRPLTQMEYYHTLVDSAAHYTGLHHEVLVKDFKNTYGVVKSTYKSLEDFVYVSTAILCGRWRLDSVAEKRFYGSGIKSPVTKSSTAYRYTKRPFVHSGDDVPWATPSRLPGILPGIKTREVIEFDPIPVGFVKSVFGDTISQTSNYEYLTGTIVYSSGHKSEYHKAYSGQSCGKKRFGIGMLPLAEMWIVDGRDSLLKRYEYGKFHSLTRPTRISIGVKGKPEISYQRFPEYNDKGLPLGVISLGGPEMRYSYDSGELISSIAMVGGDNTITTHFTHMPLVGCTSVTSPTGYKEEFGYKGGRVVSHKIGPQRRLLEEYAYEFRQGYGTANTVSVTSYGSDYPSVTKQIFDGFGAAVGNVKEHYGNGRDVLSVTRLDALGRTVRQWADLPVENAYDAIANDNTLRSASIATLGDARGYAKTAYPASADGDAERVTLAGSDFEGHSSLITKVCSNLLSPELKVRRLSWNGNALTSSGYYGAGELQGVREQDADGVTVITFNDALGRQVVRRAIGENGVFADTYTVCDAWGNAQIVIQPQGSASLTDNGLWLAGSDLIRNYAFVYEYDSRLRVTSAKLPGCEPEVTAYDNMGRVVYTRNPQLAAKGKMQFNMYDEFSRPAVTGLCDDFTSENQWKSEHTPLTVERGVGTGLLNGFEYTLAQGSAPAGGVVSDVRYYDSYPIYAERPMRMPSAEESTVIQTSPTGLPTVEISSVLKDGMPAGYLATRHYYDQYDREINTEQETPDGTVRIKRELTPGGLERKVTTAFGSVSMTERTGRDGFGRPMSTDVTLNDASNFTTGIYNYDDAGRLASVWSEGGVTTTFGYDTRGAVTSRTDRFIRQRYGYASGPGTPSYAGRLSLKAIECNTGGDWKAREYLYGYDRLGRVVAVDGSDDRNSGDDCSEVFTYDLNANILSISRKGRTGTSGYSEVDDIVMQYSGNMLSGVTDRAEDVTLESSIDIPCGSFGGNDIRHDAAGCVTRDLSRGIADISYHAPGIPACIVTIGGDSIVYDYTSTGVKLGETVWNGSRITRRGYAGPVETVDGRVVRVNVAQGYFDSLGVLHAYIPDIQGNIVGVYEAKEGVTELEQYNEYYAYGGITADSRGQDRNRRKYTAKELITDLRINSYDFSARRQYPALGRFDAPDSKAANYTWLSPYAFCGGDPINNIDPTGMDVYRFDKKSGDVTLFKKTDDDYDVIGDFKYDKENDEYILKTDRKGRPKTLIDNIEKGTLKDGMNLKEQDNVWQVGGDGNPTVEGFQEFVLELAELICLELRGYYYAYNGSDQVSYIRMGRYKHNTNRESHASGNAYRFPELRNNVYFHTDWHTHPTNASDRSRFEPSKPDKRVKKNTLKYFNIKNFMILTKGHAPIPY